MKLRNLFFRNKSLSSVEEVELWYVRWQSRYSPFCSDVKDEVKAFVRREDAEEFKKALEDAFTLIHHTSGNKVTLSKEEK